MTYGVIYKITNMVNGKFYIGQTISDIRRRFAIHMCMSKSNCCYKLKHAVAKYGKKNFIIEAVDSAESLEELDAKEKKWITETDAIKLGYNLREGGRGAPMTAKQRAKLAEMNANRDPAFHKKLGELNRQRMLGVKQSPELIEKRRIAVAVYYKEKGEYSNTDAYVSVTQYSPDGKKLKVFESLDAAMKEVGLKSCTTIIAACTDPKRNHAAGFQWRYTDDNIDELPSAKIRGRQAVSAINLTSESIYVFGSIAIAGAFLGAKDSNISRVCRKERKSSDGYFFEYL